MDKLQGSWQLLSIASQRIYTETKEISTLWILYSILPWVELTLQIQLLSAAHQALFCLVNCSGTQDA